MTLTTMMNISFCIIAATIATCFGEQLGSCLMVRNQVIQHVVHTLNVFTYIDCCRACGLNASCVAANYEEATGTCELNDANPFMGADMEKMVFLAPRCKDPWVEYMGSCYTRSEDQMSWQDSEDHCVNLGGHLADIHFQVDIAFVIQVASKKTVWLGLANIWSGQPRRWSTGIPLVYNNFVSPEPNSKGGDEDCLEMYGSGKWNDQTCTDLNHAVCKKPFN